MDKIYEFGKESFKTASDLLSKSAVFAGLLQQIEERTGISGSFIITGLTALTAVAFLLSSGPFFLCYIAIVLYPTYRSFKCLEEGNEDALNWIKYWIVFSVFHAGEKLVDKFIWWFPGLLLIKFLFLLWCFAPVPNNGATVIYDNYIRALFLRNADTLDRVTDMVTSLIHKMITGK